MALFRRSLVLSTALLISCDFSSARLLRRAPVAPPAANVAAGILGPLSQCPQPSTLQWHATPDGGAPEGDVAAVFSEIVGALGGTGHAEFTAMSTSLASIGLLRDAEGRLYASMSAPGVAADTRLVSSGAEVDVVKTSNPLPPPQLTHHGIQAVLELADDPLEGGAGHNASFLMRLHLDGDSEARRFWKGWPRSFGYRLGGYVLLPSQGVWRLLAEVSGRLVTNGQTSHSGFLGDFASAVATLSGGSSCDGSFAAANVGPAWYQVVNGSWSQFRSSSAPRGTGNMALTAPAVGPVQTVAVPPLDPPTVLSDFSMPSGDNSPAGVVAAGFRRFGPRVQQMHRWGQYHNESRIYSCVTPDLAAVMADPMQYQPPPTTPPDWSHLCEPLLAEHFWWVPSQPVEPNVEWFYNEITVEKSVPFTYFMANGFQGGYFGIQEHADNKKYALFSLWDAGNKVEIVDWGEGVQVGRFGNEGTGANSHTEFDWKLNEPVRFLVHALREAPEQPGGATTTLYSGYIHRPDLGVWRLLSRLRVRPCGLSAQTKGYLNGMNSFIEVFQPMPEKGTPACADYGRERRARYGVPWYKTTDSSSFLPFKHAVLTATCPATGCPKRGLNHYVLDDGPSQEFVLTVGANVTNNGMPISQPQAMRASSTPPAVLTDAPLPEADNSIAGLWHAGEARPLRQLGEQEQMRVWGVGKDQGLACPWYVSECGAKNNDDYGRSP